MWSLQIVCYTEIVQQMYKEKPSIKKYIIISKKK